MSSDVEWSFQVTGDAKEKLDLVDQALAGLPQDLAKVEAGFAKLDRAMRADAISKINDPLKQNRELLKLQVEDLKKAADAEKKYEDAAKKAADEAKKAQDKAQAATEKTGDELVKAFGAESLAKAFTLAGAIELVTTGLKDAASAAISAGVAVVKFGIDSAQHQRRDTFALRQTEGGDAEKTLQTLKTMANSAGAEADQAVEKFIQLRRAGFSAKEAQDIVAGGLDTGAKNGGGERGAKALDAVVEAFRKSKQTGKVEYAELFDQLGKEAGIGGDKLLEAVAKRMNTTTDKALVQLKAAKVSVGTVQNAVLDAITGGGGSVLGDAAKEFAAGDLEAQMRRIKDSAANMFPDDGAAPFVAIVRQVANLLESEPYKSEIQSLAEDFMDLFKGAEGADISQPFQAAIYVVRQVVDGIKDLKDGFSKGFDYEGLSKTTDQLDKIGAFFGDKKNSSGLELIGRYIGNIVEQAVIWAKVFELIERQTMSVIDGITSLVKQLANLGIDAVKLAGTDTTAGFAAGIAGGGPGVTAAAAAVGKIPLDTLKNLLGIHSPSREMEKLGEFTGQGFAIGLESEDPGVALADSLAAPAPGRGGGGGITVNVGDINVNGGGASGAELGAMVKAATMEAILEALEQLGYA